MNLRIETLDRVLELACIELIQRNRRGDLARVEEYLLKHPTLLDPAYLLDLVDAEICVRRELGETVKVDEWSQRFPHQTRAIMQLIALVESAKDVGERVVAGASLPPKITGASLGNSQFSDGCSFTAVEFSKITNDALTVAGGDSLSDGIIEGLWSKPTSLFALPPINPPHGFIVDSGVSTRPGVWLLRCHEENTQRPCGFKIIDVARKESCQLSSLNVKSILDAYERAAKIRHPVWVPPYVASCDGRFLGVIRPWIFGVNWRDGIGGFASDEALRLLSELAFGLHAAHQSGCHHGNVCENNLFFSHEGKLRLTDPVNSLSRFMTKAKLSQQDLVRDDAMTFCRLIASLQLDTSRGLSNQLVAQCHSLVLSAPTDPMAIVGEWLMRTADNMSQKSPLSTRRERQSVMSWWKSILFRRNRRDLAPVEPPSF